MNELLAESPFFFFPIAVFVSLMSLGVFFSQKAVKGLLFLGLMMCGVSTLFLIQKAWLVGLVHVVLIQTLLLVAFFRIFKAVKLNTEKEIQREKKPSIFKFMQIGSVGLILGLSMGTLSLKTYENLYDSENPLNEFAVFYKQSIPLFLLGLTLFLILSSFLMPENQKEL